MKRLTGTGKTCIRKSCCKFTLIELLIVVAIVSILAGMLLPALGQAKKIVERTACSSNQKQVLVLFASYCSSYNDYIMPSRLGWVQGGDHSLGGMVALLEEGGFFRGRGYSVPWKSAPAWKDPKFIWCPSVKYYVPLRDENRGSIVKRDMNDSYMRALNTDNAGQWDGGYSQAMGKTGTTYGYDGHQLKNTALAKRTYPLYLSKVKRPGQKAYLSEWLKNGGPMIPGNYTGTELLKCDNNQPSAEKTRDGMAGRHLRTVNLGMLDGHVEMKSSGDTNMAKYLGEYYD